MKARSKEFNQLTLQEVFDVLDSAVDRFGAGQLLAELNELVRKKSYPEHVCEVFNDAAVAYILLIREMKKTTKLIKCAQCWQEVEPGVWCVAARDTEKPEGERACFLCPSCRNNPSERFEAIGS